MAKRNIVKLGDDVLRKICRTQLTFDEKLHQTLDDMAETMYATNGVGLAAPQVGILRRMFVIDIGEGLIEFINPEITYQSEELQDGMEGCLSVPGKYGWVERPQKVKIKAFDRNGNPFELEAEDFMARAICHEYAHLDGELYIDVMERFLTDEELEELSTT